MGLLINLLVLLAFLSLGFFVGGYSERRHLRDLAEREAAVGDLLVTQLKSFPAATASNRPPKLLVGEAVVATDYLKSFLAGLRNIFGGEVGSYQTLLSRARREAALRILEVARAEGYNAVCNLRYQTADVGGNTSTRKTAMVAILASGTAYDAATAGTAGAPDARLAAPGSG